MSETDGAAVPLEVEPIDVDSSDEIGEVARAFDQVHREALRLASNEAALRGNVNAMFVNLSRRSQSLVERQIRLIDDLEQGEQDAERLASLFQMDHLATRMRRNSENLLVLAGHEASRRWNQPVPLVDVLRAAVSEIEQYERVTLNVQPGISVRGQAVNDVVHLIAELAENATSFSSADTPVKVSGHLLNSGGVLLDITDQGVGMGAEEMAHANWRLDNPPVVDVAVSRRMGLFVVARLAARHGIRVRLRPAAGGRPDRAGLAARRSDLARLGDRRAPAGMRRFDAAAAPHPRPWRRPAPPSGRCGQRRQPLRRGERGKRRPDTAVRATAPRLGDTGAVLGDRRRAGTRPLAPADRARLSGYDIDSRSEAETSSMSAYDTGAMPAFGAAPTFGTGARQRSTLVPPPAFDSGRPAGVRPRRRAPVRQRCRAIVRPRPHPGPRARMARPRGRTARRQHRRRRRSPSTAAPRPPRARRRRRAGRQRQRTAVPDPDDPAEERDHRPAHGQRWGRGGAPAAIFESVESDWFRRGRHGASRAGQVNSVASSSTSSGGWTSPADEGWRAAEAAHVPTSGGVTLSGLPKRVPRANLVPGTVGAETATAAAPAPARSAVARKGSAG